MPRPDTRLELERFLPYRLATLAQRLSTALSSIYDAEFGISIAEWRILANLAGKGELNPTEIAVQTSMDKARVTRALKELRAKRCLVQKRDAGDGRAYRLRLSAKGLALYGRIAPLALAWEAELLDALDAAEYRELMRLLDKLAQRTAAMGNDAGSP
jgi:DNA-binding MarR family transcriptional regulator